MSNSLYICGISLLSAFVPAGIAHAQPAELAPLASPLAPLSASADEVTEILVVASLDRSIDGTQLMPPAFPSTPPSEAVQERAPAVPAVRAYPRQADGHGVKLGGYNVSRWAEDWRLMRDSSNRDDLLDQLKYVALDSNGFAYVTLSGELRARVNLISNPGLVASEHRREHLLRLFAGADVHVGPLRFFGELAHGELGGHNYGAPAAKSRNELVVQQAFGELSGDLGGLSLGLRYGRQEFTDGPSSLVSQKDDNNIHSSLSGIRGWAQASAVRVDLFDFQQVKLGIQGTGDDRSDRATRFTGVTGGLVLANDDERKAFLDLFLWRDRNDSLRWGSATGREVRYYYGARLWGSLNLLTFDWTLDHQDGEFEGRDIDAWTAHAAQTYVLTSKHIAPKAGLRFDFGSGGGAFGSGDIQSARTPTAGTIGYSYQGALNITNLFQVSPSITVTPLKNVDITTEYQHSRRVNEDDAVYRGAGTAYAGSQTLAGSHVGDAIRLQLAWKAAPRLSIMARYEYFMPGSILDELDYDPSSYAATWVSFRF